MMDVHILSGPFEKHHSWPGATIAAVAKYIHQEKDQRGKFELEKKSANKGYFGGQLELKTRACKLASWQARWTGAEKQET